MSLLGKRIVLTGKLSHSRAEVAAMLASQGAIVVSELSATTDVLIVGERPGSKLARAQSLGVEVWSEEALERELRSAAAPAVSDASRLAAAARQEMRESAERAGVRDWSRYEPLVRDRILVQALKDAPRNHGGLGQSRFGGCADLPCPEAWPHAPGLDYVFLCQLDLADVASLDVASRLPASGLLSFFVGTTDVLGMHTEYRAVGAVLYHPANATLQPCWRSWGSPRQRGMSMVLSPAPPPWNSTLVGNEDATYCDWYDTWEARDQNRVRSALLTFDRVFESELQPSEEMLLCCWRGESIDYRFVEAVTLNFAIDCDRLAERDWSAVRYWEGCSI